MWRTYPWRVLSYNSVTNIQQHVFVIGRLQVTFVDTHELFDMEQQLSLQWRIEGAEADAVPVLTMNDILRSQAELERYRLQYRLQLYRLKKRGVVYLTVP